MLAIIWSCPEVLYEQYLELPFSWIIPESLGFPVNLISYSVVLIRHHCSALFCNLIPVRVTSSLRSTFDSLHWALCQLQFLERGVVHPLNLLFQGFSSRGVGVCVHSPWVPQLLCLSVTGS